MDDKSVNSGEFNPEAIENALQQAFLSGNHPDPDILAGHALGTLSASEAKQLEAHLAACAICRAAFHELQEEVEEVDEYLGTTIVSETVKFAPGQARKPASVFYLPVFRYAAAAVVLIGLFYTSVSVYPELFLSKKTILGDIGTLQPAAITRGLENPQLQQAQFEIQNKNYDRAIALLEAYTATENVDGFYVHYMLGLTYLQASKHTTLLVIPGYREGYVAKAKEHLLTCIHTNTNPQLANISLDASFYAAKASLLLGQTDEARQLLNRVITEKGSMMDEAKNLIGRL